jgi:ssRNA-specific RNase YbeY (16S rRNA maturation enzyme)
VTDVITMTYAPTPVQPEWSGELIINTERALEVGPRFGGAGRELALYLAHGIDHLTGGVDDTPAERRRMRRRELGWLKHAAREGLLEPLAPFGAPPP